MTELLVGAVVLVAAAIIFAYRAGYSNGFDAGVTAAARLVQPAQTVAP